LIDSLPMMLFGTLTRLPDFVRIFVARHVTAVTTPS
jgi:hypothetical protein